MIDGGEDLRTVPAWLLSEPHHSDDGTLFAKALATHLRAAGVPLWRVSYALMTMHPEVLWRTVQWRDGEVTLRDQPRARLDDPFYTKSAVAAVREKRVPVRVRLASGDLPYPICTDLRDEGGTDYFVVPLPFSNGQLAYASFATNEADGFSDAHLDMIRSLSPFLATRLELESAYYATRALLEVYLGKNAARRVVSGAVRRGQGEMIDAVIWLCDMRGFTELGERAPPMHVVSILDAYFDAMASAVSEHGGEVLKFIGDAVLAIFPVESDPSAACRRALDAATQAFAALARVNEERAGKN
ncbi:MAG: adenylate/guanylate cyclase domain-containing protein, partial [Polyangiaceae bacterium]